MSVMKFQDLPEDIEILIAEESVKFYETKSSSEYQQVMDTALKGLSILSPVFRKLAQAELFRRVRLFTPLGDQSQWYRLLDVIEGQPRLGLEVKNLEMSIFNSRNIERTVLELLALCPNIIRVSVLTESEMHLNMLTQAKRLQYLSIKTFTLKSFNNFSIFPNLKFLELSNKRFLGCAPFTPKNFPSLLSLSQDCQHGWQKFDKLFPQIKNLSIQYRDVKGWIQEVGTMESLSNLKVIEVGWIAGEEDMTSFINAISRLPTSLSVIRFFNNFYDENDWELLKEFILEGSALGELSLFKAQLESVGIQLIKHDGEELFEDWTKQFEEDG